MQAVMRLNGELVRDLPDGIYLNIEDDRYSFDVNLLGPFESGHSYRRIELTGAQLRAMEGLEVMIFSREGLFKGAYIFTQGSFKNIA
jgi:hypothetical protein